MLLADWKYMDKQYFEKAKGKRNETHLPSQPTWAPSLAKALRDVIIKQNSDIKLRPSEMKQEWSEYYTKKDMAANENKYHYYAIYSFEDENGDTKYSGANCSGRIGIIERAFDLTKKFSGGPVDTFEDAQADVQKHLVSKTTSSKGYAKDKLASVKVAEDMPLPHYVDPRLVKEDGEMIGETSLDAVEDTKKIDFDVFHSEDGKMASKLVKMAKMLLSEDKEVEAAGMAKDEQLQHLGEEEETEAKIVVGNDDVAKQILLVAKELLK